MRVAVVEVVAAMAFWSRSDLPKFAAQARSFAIWLLNPPLFTHGLTHLSPRPFHVQPSLFAHHQSQRLPAHRFHHPDPHIQTSGIPAITTVRMPSKHSPTTTHPWRQSAASDDDDEVNSWDALSNPSHSSSSSSDDGLVAKLPTLPDLRFEQSYLATIRGFLHEDRPEDSSSSGDAEKGNVEGEDEEDHHHKAAITHSKSGNNEHELWLGYVSRAF